MDAIQLDNPTLVVIVLAVVIIVVALIFRQKIRLFLKGPGGTELNLDASNQRAPTPPAAVVKGSTSHKGGILAKDATGRGAVVEDSEADQHIIATVTPPGNPSPKP